MRSHRFTRTARPFSSFASRNAGGNLRISELMRWLGTILSSRLNQNVESCVSTRPLSGIGVGNTTSNAERRSLATITSLSPPASYTSRTLPRRQRRAPFTSDSRSAAPGSVISAAVLVRSFGQQSFELLAPERRDRTRGLRRQAAVFLGPLEHASFGG